MILQLARSIEPTWANRLHANQLQKNQCRESCGLYCAAWRRKFKTRVIKTLAKRSALQHHTALIMSQSTYFMHQTISHNFKVTPFEFIEKLYGSWN